MGAASSTEIGEHDENHILHFLQNSNILQHLLSNEPISRHSAIFKTTLPLFEWSSIPFIHADSLLKKYLFDDLTQLNPKTGNLRSLFLFCIDYLKEFNEELSRSNVKVESRVYSLKNVIFFVRILLKQLCDRRTVADIFFHLDYAPFPFRNAKDISYQAVNETVEKDENTLSDELCQEESIIEKNTYTSSSTSSTPTQKNHEFYATLHFLHKDVIDVHIQDDQGVHLQSVISEWFSSTYKDYFNVIQEHGFAFCDQNGQMCGLSNIYQICKAKPELCTHNNPLCLFIIPFGSTFLNSSDVNPENQPAVIYFMLQTCLFLKNVAITYSLYTNQVVIQIQEYLLECLLIFFARICPKSLTSYINSDPLINTLDTDECTFILPDTQLQSAHFAPSYYLHLQSQLKPPYMVSPSASHRDVLSPFFPFVDMFLYVLENGYSISTTENAVKETTDECLPDLSQEFACYLLNLLWKSEILNSTFVGGGIWNIQTQFKDSAIIKVKDHFFTEKTPKLPNHLSDCGMAILLLLIFHPSKTVRNAMLQSQNLTEIEMDDFQNNCFAQAFGSLYDQEYFSESLNTFENESPTADSSMVLDANFPGLFALISSQRLKYHLVPLVCYTLLHKNRKFRLFCLSRSECHHLAFAILEILQMVISDDTSKSANHSDEEAQKFQYLPAPPAIVILSLTFLILSHDHILCQQLFRTKTLDSNSMQLRLSDNASVGDAATLIISRLFSWNYGTFRDKFLFEICAAILINMAPCVVDIHWDVAEKLIAYLKLFSRFLLNCIEPLSNDANLNIVDEKSVSQQLEAILVVLRCLLIMISTSLTPPNLANNTELLYALNRAFPLKLFKTIRETSHNLMQNPMLNSALSPDKDLSYSINDGASTDSTTKNDTTKVGPPILKHIYRLVEPFIDYLECLYSYCEAGIQQHLSESETTSIAKYKEILIRISKEIGDLSSAVDDETEAPCKNEREKKLVEHIKEWQATGSVKIRFDYMETSEKSNFFLPLLWKSIYAEMPDHICWESQKNRSK